MLLELSLCDAQLSGNSSYVNVGHEKLVCAPPADIVIKAPSSSIKVVVRAKCTLMFSYSCGRDLYTFRAHDIDLHAR